MIKPELLIPVGDEDCLKAAIQNGADAVYFGASSFNARSSAHNFNNEELKNAINYAHLRNVKTHLTLNTLIKNNEFEDAVSIAKTAYEYGIDAIIVQDLGLAKFLIDNFPNIDIHASTQMTTHNLEGVKFLENLGCSRVVLSREMSINEITNICKNTKVEIETFIHGALCMSYSGRCLLSSMIGGRSGNRGTCAQPCRLPYELISNTEILDKGFLLSPRDFCSLEQLPELVKAGVTSFKIEGRMKTPEYVAIVTKIYRKYLNKIINNENYIIDEKDKNDLTQIYNRGGFSSGHLNSTANLKLVYKEKSNNMGIKIGTVKRFIPKNSYIEIELKNQISIGDGIMIDGETNKYNVSEILVNDKHQQSAKFGIIKLGRIKGNIKTNANVYKISDKILEENARLSYEKEFKKIPLNAEITIKIGSPISLKITTLDTAPNSLYFNEIIKTEINTIPEKANNMPLSKERVIEQLNKTGNTEYSFNEIQVIMDNNVYIPKISALNELRRNTLEKLQNRIISKSSRKTIETKFNNFTNLNITSNEKHLSILLNTLHTNYNYEIIKNTGNFYVPFKFFLNKQYKEIIKKLPGNVYIFMPSIIRENYKKLINTQLNNILQTFNITGFVISNLADLSLIPDTKKYKVIGNFTLNIFNNYTIAELQKYNFTKLTISPELSKITLNVNTNQNIEYIIYGATPVMTTNYCLLGKANHCYKECSKLCNSNEEFYLKDRMNFKFRIIPDNIETVTTIYNSKITSILPNDIPFNNLRIDVIDETPEEINKIVHTILENKRMEGSNYTNGNFNREV